MSTWLHIACHQITWILVFWYFPFSFPCHASADPFSISWPFISFFLMQGFCFPLFLTSLTENKPSRTNKASQPLVWLYVCVQLWWPSFCFPCTTLYHRLTGCFFFFFFVFVLCGLCTPCNEKKNHPRSQCPSCLFILGKLYIIQSIYTCLMIIGGRCGGAGSC